MKKLFYLAMAVAAISLASCGGRTAATAELDSLACDSSACCEKQCPKAQANEVVALLGEQLKSADPEQIKGIATTIGEKVAQFLSKGDTEAAETYTAVISNFIAENAAKLQEIGATEAVTQALAKVEGLPSDIIETATEAVTGVKSAALTSAISAIAKGESVVDAVKAAATEVAADGQQIADDAKATVEAVPEAVQEAAKAKTEEAAENVKQQATDAANKAIDDAAAAAKKKLGL
ncbi:MAG: hypothetical protein IJ209_02520 [Bacteroidaceae bacterium]|nr:hypothetical protein [Bacteroidaceae bacterium]